MSNPSAPNTKFKYIYRDASNYKWLDEVIVSGRLCREDVQKYLIDSEFFIPELVGLKSLTPEIRNEDDHDWHAIFSLIPTSEPAGPISATEIVNRFRTQHMAGWPYG